MRRPSSIEAPTLDSRRSKVSSRNAMTPLPTWTALHQVVILAALTPHHSLRLARRPRPEHGLGIQLASSRTTTSALTGPGAPARSQRHESPRLVSPTTGAMQY